ncbi:FAD-binding and (Fe-S)-binding domain-containing protein [Desulfatitalea alkaliphila]|uniref:D-lactate dehydrogenase (cytochrome) n=1 Tax=Desulfatitalea alkaliphila TaxID=2929485 RepID=A0AA41R358_9BACT|nr:FAD-binding and (Fe-S)-binding domain-containing protein [Desulfatitalea alkaliphila]MCJ8502247.1 FAD-binding protein [Desulfatitalea alkaliphila]
MSPSGTLQAPFGELAAAIAGEVHTDPVRRSLLATDGSIFQKMPAAVVYPLSEADVQAVVRFAARRGFSVHARGAGSGLCGASLGDGIVVDFSKFMHRLRRLDLQAGIFVCEPGYRLGELEVALKGSGRFFPPDPSSGEYATFGGMSATNASGAHSVKYGNVADYLLDARVVFADGTAAQLSVLAQTPIDQLPGAMARLARLYQQHAATIESAYPDIRCNVAGYNLRGLVQDDRLFLHRLLCGAEGTLGIVTELHFALRDRPAADALLVAYFDDIVSAARAVQQAMPLGPSGIEIMDKSLLQLARDSDPALKEAIPADIDNVLLMEFDGPSAEACARPAEQLQRQLAAAGLTQKAHLAVSATEKEKFWALRKAAVPTLYTLKGRRKVLALVEDAAVPVDRLVPYFEGVYDLFRRRRVPFVLYGHIAKGLMHTRPLLDLKDPADVALLRPIADDVYTLVDVLGGTVSGEHGDGRLRTAYVRRKYSAIYDLFVQTKQLLDPGAMLNPEIKVYDDPDQMTKHLRYGAAYQARPPAALRLDWGGRFAEEVEKCHGCTKCTTLTTATRMCPVYKFTRDEAAAPKAKANVLRALISGAVPEQTLFQQGLQHVMAQCVNCGSCFLECPSHVHIPKMAMEAKAQYARRYGVPLPQRLTAHVELAAKLTHRFTPVIAPLARRPAVARWAARLAGLAPQRPPVLFDRRSLYQRLPRRMAGDGPRVLYYAGCYAGYIRPELGETAVRVLQAMGCAVDLPRQYCCGLPQISKGLAGAARRAVENNRRAWADLAARADHIAVTCSSCGYALMHDWAHLIGEEAAAGISAKTIHITHLLRNHQDRLPPARLPLHVAYHHPCHLRIQPAADSTIRLLSAIEALRFDDLRSHCCGIAGSWGMLAANDTLSRTIGAPMIQRLNHSGAAAGVTDCPTCQMQMEHLGNLPVLHPVEVVWQAIRNSVA